MEECSTAQKPHAVCIPLPAQGHINPMLKLAKLLNSAGFHITFVHTEFNYKQFLHSNPTWENEDDCDFRFETVSDGLPESSQRGILDLPELCISMPVHLKKSFRDLLTKLNGAQNLPPVSCIVSDGVMSYTLEVARELRIPEILFFTPSTCGMSGYLQYEELIKRGYFPLKDESYLSNGYLETELDWVPGMKGVQLKHIPSFCHTTNPKDTMFNYNLESVQNALKTGALILNTFEELEQEVLDAMREKFPNLYSIGPLSLLEKQLPGSSKLDSLNSSLWKQDLGCLEWLESKNPGTVLYVNYGSLVTLTPEELKEFAWGLADSKIPFLWVIRPNMVDGGEEAISTELLNEVNDRGLVVDWCPQERVLNHASIGGFLMHCGWNSTLESICSGVPMICWPFFAEQAMNSLYICSRWGVGMEIGRNVGRNEVEGLVKELMEGKKGMEMKEKVMEWKEKAERATQPGGTSFKNFDLLTQRLGGHPLEL